MAEPRAVAGGSAAACRAIAAENQHCAARPATGLRLHAGKLEIPAFAHDRDGPGSHRLDGHRYADLGAIIQAEAAPHLFQAELRPGDESAHRPDPRRAGYEPRLFHWAAAEHSGPERHIQAQMA